MNEFVADLILCGFYVWLVMTPYFAVSGVIEFFARRRQRQIDRIYGRRTPPRGLR